MATNVSTGSVHHVTLTVSDVARSVDFYTGILGFQMAVELGERKILSNGSTLLAITPPPNPKQAIKNDRFSENRVGLDHLSFSVSSREDFDTAKRAFDERGVAYGEVDEYPDLGICTLAFRDPDNIQVELTAPYG
jgi:catechol 2,3-dioxygenase-like lactoylglutathione lyase family enzyme